MRYYIPNYCIVNYCRFAVNKAYTSKKKANEHVDSIIKSGKGDGTITIMDIKGEKAKTVYLIVKLSNISYRVYPKVYSSYKKAAKRVDKINKKEGSETNEWKIFEIGVEK